MIRKVLAALCLAVLLAGSSVAAEMPEPTPEPSDSAVVFDVLLIRPLSLASLAVGSGIFIVGLPFTVPTGSLGVSAKRLIGDPFWHTFMRPIGETLD